MFNKPKIEFLCYKEDIDVIPKPYSARKHLPEWYKKLPMKTGKGLSTSTIKRCPPFLDAMQIGFIIPLAADVAFQTNENASGVSYQSNFYRTMVENHGMNQIYPTKGDLNPLFPKPPMKFLNWWAIKINKGWSVLFIPPINRPDPRFECIGGLVDCDQYFQFINFPFTFNQLNYDGIIEAGTPLVQAIPLKRSNLLKEFGVRHLDDVEAAQITTTERLRMSHESHYRDNAWERK